MSLRLSWLQFRVTPEPCLIAYQSKKSQVSITNVENEIKNNEHMVKLALNDPQKKNNYTLFVLLSCCPFLLNLHAWKWQRKTSQCWLCLSRICLCDAYNILQGVSKNRSSSQSILLNSLGSNKYWEWGLPQHVILPRPCLACEEWTWVPNKTWDGTTLDSGNSELVEKVDF